MPRTRSRRTTVASAPADIPGSAAGVVRDVLVAILAADGVDDGLGPLDDRRLVVAGHDQPVVLEQDHLARAAASPARSPRRRAISRASGRPGSVYGTHSTSSPNSSRAIASPSRAQVRALTVVGWVWIT